jgi:hypothetical protein
MRVASPCGIATVVENIALHRLPAVTAAVDMAGVSLLAGLLL